MSHHVEKIAFGAWRVGNQVAWAGLKMTRMDQLMSQILSTVVPSRYESFWAGAETRHKREREEQIVRDLGKITAHAFRGNIDVDYRELEPVWEKVMKEGQTGVRFEDVHDPHTAILLHNITPDLNRNASTEQGKQL